ncbi:Ax dynein light domain containing protein [Asbolus verrucosus]|uniref:tRNA-dihydrouridine(47) synthase [NAD(P)(+)] n=1 Tax=Asbolus verrucosus TaxID=1661398 RepID=A0A482W9D1_ASBVE|nr:Ax dynein light domain containing protein [Asbolus verrucosus]
MSDSGICTIKPEFVLAEYSRELSLECVSDKDKRKLTDDASEMPPEKKQKLSKSEKKKLSGQNKSRGPTFRCEREKELCNTLINLGIEDEIPKCERKNCKFLHDIQEYLKIKAKDIGEICYNYQTFGKCSRDEDIIKLTQREKKKIDWRDKLVLSPLTTVGNLPFRRICKEFGADITCGEMAMCSSLLQGAPQEWALAPKFRNWGASLITIHGRSREQRYTKLADWQYIREVAKAAAPLPVLGNGDVLSYEDYKTARETCPELAGIMIGRGALIKPWIFNEIKEQKLWDIRSCERFEILKKYTNYGLEHWGSDNKGVENTRRFLLEWLSFLYRYVPVGLLEHPPQKINERPPSYRGRDELETLMASASATDWIKISEMLLGPQELETKNQALYDCERHKKTTQALVDACQEEIRILQNEGTLENNKLESRIQQLEESNLNLKISYNEQINSLEKDLANKEDEINNLKRELDDIIKISENQQPINEEKLLNEICELKRNNLVLQEQVDDLVKSCDNKEKQNVFLQETISQLKEEVQNYREILTCKKSELDEANDLIQTLKDDFLCVQSELDLVKSKPLDEKSRGNSLFAEVDDRRVQLQQNMNIMKTKYVEMKRERASLLKQITVVRNENATLLARWEAEVTEAKDDQDMILLSYKNQIRTLSELVESYEKEIKEKFHCDNAVSGEMKFYGAMLAAKNQEIENLRQKLSSKSLSETLFSHDLAQARKAIRKHKLETMKLQNEIGQLNVQIEEMHLTSPTESISQQEKTELKSTVKKDIETEREIKIIDLNDTNKENQIVAEKRVQFTENTAEPNVTDRKKLRKGAKILESKPMFISSIPKCT